VSNLSDTTDTNRTGRGITSEEETGPPVHSDDKQQVIRKQTVGTRPKCEDVWLPVLVHCLRLHRILVNPLHTTRQHSEHNVGISE